MSETTAVAIAVLKAADVVMQLAQLGGAYAARAKEVWDRINATFEKAREEGRTVSEDEVMAHFEEGDRIVADALAKATLARFTIASLGQKKDG